MHRNEAQSETEEEEETAQEKRLRLAKKYLKEIEEEGTKFNEKYFMFDLYYFEKEKSFI